jgi:hypothetical protein
MNNYWDQNEQLQGSNSAITTIGMNNYKDQIMPVYQGVILLELRHYFRDGRKENVL